MSRDFGHGFLAIKKGPEKALSNFYNGIKRKYPIRKFHNLQRKKVLARWQPIL